MDKDAINIALPPDPEELKQIRKRRYLRCNILVSVVVFFAITGFLWFGKRPSMAVEENRKLAKCPKFSITSYLDGTFTSEFAAFFNDTVPMRSTFKRVISGFRAHLGIPYEDVYLHGNAPTLDHETPEETEQTENAAPETTAPAVTPTETALAETNETTPPDTTEAPTTEAEEYDEDVDGEVTNNILIVKNRGIMLYGGGTTGGEEYAQLLNTYKQKMGADVNVYSMVANTPVSFYLPKKFNDLTASENDNIDHINSLLQGVTPVDVYDALLPHKDEAIYFRTDHHWQPLGAYYAAEAFANAAGVPFAPLSDYETVTKEGYTGSLYVYTNSKVFLDDPEPFVYYKPTNAITTTYYNTDLTNEREAPLMLNIDNLEPVSWYMVFMGGDERITHVKTDCTNGRRLCIIKDSYGNALVPCLTSSFEDIWVVDMRYFKPNIITFMQEREITDVLFAMNTFSATGVNHKKLQKLLDQ